MRINRWIYLATATFGTFALGAVSGAFDNPFAIAAASMFVAALTFPLGLVAQLLTLPLIYAGIATPAEAIVVMSPVYAALGYFQWYVLLPRLYGSKSC